MPAKPVRATTNVEIRAMTPHEFAQFSKLAYKQFGLDLQAGKEQLVAARLSKQMRELKIDAYSDYYDHVLADTTGEALGGLIDALTTNHTSFFRERAHFDFLRDVVVPELASRRRISIWSAACSTGEEPYSLVFCILQGLGMEALPKLRVLATDVSSRVLATARNGIYAGDRFRGIAPETLRSFLLRAEKDGQEAYLVRKEIRAAIDFQLTNLTAPFLHGRTFPLIVCRNVMIYFDLKTRQDLVTRLAACLEPGGYLFIGHAESLNGLDMPLRFVRPAVYRKPGPADSRLNVESKR